MQTQISVFQFQDNQNVRVEIKNGEPWFCLKDVTDILAIKNHNEIAARLKENGVTKIQIIDGLKRKQEATFINEPNLYRVIFRSNKAEAVKFQDWIFEDVIPQIRKTGSYGVSGSLKAKTTVDERTGLRDAVNALVGKRGLSYSEAYQMVHQRFGVGHIDELPRTKIKQAVEYVHRITLDGEVLDKEPLLTESEFKALMHMFAKLGTYTLTLRDLQKNLMLKPEKLSYWFSSLTNAPEEGFLFFFNPDINRDLDDAANIIRRHKHLIA